MHCFGCDYNLQSQRSFSIRYWFSPKIHQSISFPTIETDDPHPTASPLVRGKTRQMATQNPASKNYYREYPDKTTKFSQHREGSRASSNTLQQSQQSQSQRRVLTNKKTDLTFYYLLKKHTAINNVLCINILATSSYMAKTISLQKCTQ